MSHVLSDFFESSHKIGPTVISLLHEEVFISSIFIR